MLTKSPKPSLRRLRRTDLFKSGFCVWGEVEGLTAEVDGRIVGYAGVQKITVHYWAFFNVFDDIVLAPFWLHRLVKNVLGSYEKVGMGPIYSLLDPVPTAERWHEVLGFRPLIGDERDDEVRACEAQDGRVAWIKGGAR